MARQTKASAPLARERIPVGKRILHQIYFCLNHRTPFPHQKHRFPNRSTPLHDAPTHIVSLRKQIHTHKTQPPSVLTALGGDTDVIARIGSHVLARGAEKYGTLACADGRRHKSRQSDLM